MRLPSSSRSARCTGGSRDSDSEWMSGGRLVWPPATVDRMRTNGATNRMRMDVLRCGRMCKTRIMPRGGRPGMGCSLRRRPGEQRRTLQELAISVGIEVVLIAHVLAHAHVFPQHQCRANRPRLRKNLRILDERLVVDLVAVDAREPLCHAQ